MKTKTTLIMLFAAALILTGCSAGTALVDTAVPERRSAGAVTTAVTEQQTETQPVTTTVTEPAPAPYKFNPHVYSPMFEKEIPQSHWDAFYHLCDALRVGETTFACESQEAYEWATDSVVLGHLFPPACTKISGESDDGTVPFENGTGRIYYKMPIIEYVARQKEFEAKVTNVLNNYVEPDDTDFEKCLKLYDYMESNYTYRYDEGIRGDGAHYCTFMEQTGICSELSGVYAYLLLQVGVDATEVGCFAPGMCHSWTYVILDGKGYHVDPTWSLKDDREDPLCLEYFMMTDEHRNNDGCFVDDLTVDILPQYWASRSVLDFTATDSRYSTAFYAQVDELDEVNKVVRCTDMYDNSFEIRYGEAQ